MRCMSCPPFVACVALLAGVVAALSGCAECTVNGECAIGNQCLEGSCLPIPGDGVEVISPVGDVDGAFDLALRVRFTGSSAILSIERVGGDPCVPFVPVRQRLLGADRGAFEQDVVIAGLPALGASFKLAIVLDVLGKLQRTDVELRGPDVGDQVGGFLFELPNTDEVDVVGLPWQPLRGESRGGVVEVQVEPVGAPATPRSVVGSGESAVATFVPLVRGPQIVRVRTTDGGVSRSCGRGLIGVPDDDDGGRLEVALLTESEQPGWLTASVRVQDQDGEHICDANRVAAVCEARVPRQPLQHNAETLLIDVDDGIVEVAGVPRAISGPVTAWLRITRAGRHVALIGPTTVFPSEAQSWLAARIILQAGLIQAVDDVGEIGVGAPW